MNTRLTLLTLNLVLALGYTGCHTPPPAAPLVIHASPAPVVLAPAPTAVAPRAASVPLYRPPVVVEVEARPYINAANELVVPGKRFVVVDPGGWNPEALEQPERAAIPEIMRRNLGIPRLEPTTGPALAALPERVPAPPSRPPDEGRDGLIGRLPWDQVRVTGLADPGAEAQAQDYAAADPWKRVPLWTPQFGWLLVPASLLAPEPLTAPANPTPE